MLEAPPLIWQKHGKRASEKWSLEDIWSWNIMERTGGGVLVVVLSD